MSEKKVAKPVALAVGAALAGSFALTSGTVANAETVESPFALSTLKRAGIGVACRITCEEASAI